METADPVKGFRQSRVLSWLVRPFLVDLTCSTLHVSCKPHYRTDSPPQQAGSDRAALWKDEHWSPCNAVFNTTSVCSHDVLLPCTA